MIKKRGLIILLISLIAITSFASAASQCATQGVHGVEIAGYCFDCGESDGICPEDFGVSEADCPGDNDCTYVSSGFWSLNGINMIQGNNQNHPLHLDSTYTIENKRLYLIVTNTGQTSGNIALDIFENGDNTKLETRNAKINSLGVATGNWTADFNDAGVHKVYFKWGNKQFNNLYINFTIGSESADVCADYTISGETICNNDPDRIGGDISNIEYYPSENENTCQFFDISKCTWANGKCSLEIETKLNESYNNNLDCNAYFNNNPKSCVYNENKEGNCVTDDFFRITYTSTANDCPQLTPAVIPCPQRLRVPFFGIFGFITSIIVISLIYLVLNKRKEEL